LGNMIFCKTLFENNCFYSYSYGPLIVNYIVCYKLNQDQIKVPSHAGRLFAFQGKFPA